MTGFGIEQRLNPSPENVASSGQGPVTTGSIVNDADVNVDGQNSAGQSSGSESSGGETLAEMMPVDPTPIVSGADLAGPAVPVHLPLHTTIYQGAAFAISALLSPYLVIPIGTFLVVASQPGSWAQLSKWIFISIFFSTIVPALYVGIQVLRGKITDIHVMERDQRDGPFVVAIVSSFIGAWTLWLAGSYPAVWILGLVLAVNGVVLFVISIYWKISMHVSVLAATVLVGMIMIPGVSPWRLLWMIPVLMWARVTRQRHTIWQGVAAFVVAWLLTGGTLYVMGQWPDLLDVLKRLTRPL